MVCRFCKEEVNDGAGKRPTCGEYLGVRRAWHTLVWAAKAGNVEFSGRCNIVPFTRVVYQDARPKGGKEQISDHLPLWAEFEVNILTQHLEQLLNRQ